jgi:predicted RNase H-like HicB family nuclease
MGTAMAKRELVQRFEVVFEPDEDGGFHVYVPVLKGCHSWGISREEAREHVKEAIELWLETAREQGIPIPDRETVEISPG